MFIKYLKYMHKYLSCTMQKWLYVFGKNDNSNLSLNPCSEATAFVLCLQISECNFICAYRKCNDQTAWMQKLVKVFAVSICNKNRFQCRASFAFTSFISSIFSWKFSLKTSDFNLCSYPGTRLIYYKIKFNEDSLV